MVVLHPHQTLLPLLPPLRIRCRHRLPHHQWRALLRAARRLPSSTANHRRVQRLRLHRRQNRQIPALLLRWPTADGGGSMGTSCSHGRGGERGMWKAAYEVVMRQAQHLPPVAASVDFSYLYCSISGSSF